MNSYLAYAIGKDRFRLVMMVKSMRIVQNLAPSSLGIILMLLAIFSLSSMDVMVKLLSEKYEIWFLVWFRYIAQMVFATIVVTPNFSNTIKTSNLRLQFIRAFFLFAGTILFFSGLASIDLASATAMLQTNPFFIVIAAYFVLGESLTWKKFAGVIVGLLGAMIIIRPGSEVFTIHSLYPVGAAIGFAGYAIVTRYLSRSESVWTSFFYTTLLGTIFATFIIIFYWTTPSWNEFPQLILCAIFGIAGQYLIIRALYLTEASTLAPYGYSSLVFATGYGVIIFGELPDIWTYAGAFIIVGSGLYIWLEQKKSGKYAPKVSHYRK